MPTQAQVDEFVLSLSSSSVTPRHALAYCVPVVGCYCRVCVNFRPRAWHYLPDKLKWHAVVDVAVQGGVL